MDRGMRGQTWNRRVCVIHEWSRAYAPSFCVFRSSEVHAGG